MFIFYSLMKKINLSLIGKALLILSTLYFSKCYTIK